MFNDLQQLDSEQTFHCDLCIMGAGAAGITIATQLAESGQQIMLIESGGFNLDIETQNLYATENIGLNRVPQIATRQRYFGGSTHMWAGRSAPLSALDFETRDWVEHSGWPLTREDLDPYYERAGKVLGLGPGIDDNIWTTLGEERPDPWFNQDKLRTQFWQFSQSPNNPKQPLNFGRDYRDFLDKSENIRVLLHANATNLQAVEQGNHVDYIDVKSLNGKQARIYSKRYVLACGGIENARLLLASNSVEAAGLGNRHDVVGRYFMEHPRGESGIVMGDDLYTLGDKLNQYWLDSDTGRHVYLAGVAASDTLQKSRSMLNCDVSLRISEDPESGTRAMERLMHGDSNATGSDIYRVLADLGEVFDSTQRRLLSKRPPVITPQKITFECHIEQAPNPQSRISLSDKKDALGSSLTRMDWQLTQQEHHAINTLSKTMATEFGRLKLGRVKLADWVLNSAPGWETNIQDVAHHMGATRMSDSVENGVVDKHCKVHSVDNLYIAGSSVFPTSGCVNPTLTIVALAIRMADTLNLEKSVGSQKSTQSINFQSSPQENTDA